jgi:hypothetical protein
LALGRKPTKAELGRAVTFLQEQARQYQSDSGAELASPAGSSMDALVDFCQVIFASNEFIYID